MKIQLLLCVCFFQYFCAVQGNTALVCEGHSSTIRCGPGTSIDISSANYGRTSTSDCNPAVFGIASIHNVACYTPGTTDILKARCSGKRDCLLEANNRVFGDPCRGTYKYLSVTYTCKQASSVSYACEGQTLSLRCPGTKRIRVNSASYGRSTITVCNPAILGIRVTSMNLHCRSVLSELRVKALCEGQHSCNVPATNSLFGDPCGGTYKYLTVNYSCY